ncbi:hypothetical protein GF362_02790 [Candidatus Dojkabacteria bacterium]|nr:hypothetical protein [Candidatus Dojkabacteria bacterium]
MANIVISKPNKFKHKVEQFIKDGKDNLHIISDCDRTLTKCVIDGVNMPALIQMISLQESFNCDYSKKAEALFKKYHPLELDDKISQERKNEYMHEWWSKHYALLIKCGLNRTIIERIISKYEDVFRKYVLEFLSLLNQNEVPLLIFSSGLGDLITGFLEKEESLYQNITIVSNFFNFNNKDEVIGLKSEIVHVFNKFDIKKHASEYIKKTKERTNIILIGDSMGDLRMTEQLEFENIIRIGFLNEDVDKKIKKYEEEYDLVLFQNSSFKPILSLLKQIS